MLATRVDAPDVLEGDLKRRSVGLEQRDVGQRFVQRGEWNPVGSDRLETANRCLELQLRFGGRTSHGLGERSRRDPSILVARVEVHAAKDLRLEATSNSDFVLGDDLNAAPFFTGGVSRVEGSRLRAR